MSRESTEKRSPTRLKFSCSVLRRITGGSDAPATIGSTSTQPFDNPLIKILKRVESLRSFAFGSRGFSTAALPSQIATPVIARGNASPGGFDMGIDADAMVTEFLMS